MFDSPAVFAPSPEKEVEEKITLPHGKSLGQPGTNLASTPRGAATDARAKQGALQGRRYSGRTETRTGVSIGSSPFTVL